MTKTALLLALAFTTLAGMPVQAQQRVFVASFGLDTNPCIVTAPCRSFQAFDYPQFQVLPEVGLSRQNLNRWNRL
jgi:hypothetical protein